MQYEPYRRYVAEHLDTRTLLEQLAEESAELSQAALKYIRATKLSNNPTPKTPTEAQQSLIEEMADVRMVGGLLGLCPAPDSYKWERWAFRLGYEDGVTTDE